MLCNLQREAIVLYISILVEVMTQTKALKLIKFKFRQSLVSILGLIDCTSVHMNEMHFRWGLSGIDWLTVNWPLAWNKLSGAGQLAQHSFWVNKPEQLKKLKQIIFSFKSIWLISPLKPGNTFNLYSSYVLLEGRNFCNVILQAFHLKVQST